MPNPMVIDLSHHNLNPDFTKARADGVAGVIHKATQGIGFVDSQYASRRPAAIAAGLLWGAYHFGTGDDVDAQVDHFLKVAKPDGTFVLALDFEPNTTPPMNSMSLEQAKVFLTVVRKKTGQGPKFYTSNSYMKETVGTEPDSDLATYDLWWAQYANAPRLHATWQKFWLWQYSDGAAGPEKKTVDGIGSCDCDFFDGDEATLRATWLT